MKSVWISPTTQNSLKIAGRGLLSSGIKIKKVNLTQNRKPLQISMEKEKKRYQLVWEREAGGFFYCSFGTWTVSRQIYVVTVTNVNALKQSIFFF